MTTDRTTKAGEVLALFVTGKDVSHHARRVVLDFIPRIEREAATGQRYDGRIEAFDAVLAYLGTINGNGYDEPRDPALDTVWEKVRDLRSRNVASRAVDRAAHEESGT